ncbi:MAG TPA: MarR family transcriptional regulator [Dehalococcoidia bacterium]|nr:MarR family transcriptional regulator [Dehalococcoidia bacterium]
MLLSEDETIERVIAEVGRLNMTLEPLRIQAWEAYGVTVSQLRVMHLIRQMGAPSQRELTLALKISGPTLSGMIDRLIQRGVIERRDDALDRRITRVSVTAEGDDVLRALEQAGHAVLGEALAAIGPAARQRLARDLASFATATEAVMNARATPHEPVAL